MARKRYSVSTDKQSPALRKEGIRAASRKSATAKHSDHSEGFRLFKRSVRDEFQPVLMYVIPELTLSRHNVICGAGS